MENFYEEVYQYLIERGIEDDEATEVVNHLYEANVHEYGLLTENRGKAILNMLKAVGMMSGILKTPTAKQAVKATTKRLTGTPLQGRLLTKTGRAQNFTGGRTPFTGTDPVPAASSALPQPKASPVQTPGQLKLKLFPAAKPKAVSDPLPIKVQTPAPKPEFGPSAAKPTLYPKPKELRPGGQTPAPEFKTTQPSRTNPGGAIVIPRTNANTRVVQPPAPKPNFGQTAKSVKVSKVVDTVRSSNNAKKALATGAVGTVAGSAALVDTANKESNARRAERQQQRDTKLAQQKAETQAASQPKPEPTGERSAAANAEKQEVAKANAQRRRAAAADFDKTFAAKRAAGEKEFTWRGKKYTTKLKGE